MNKLAALIKRRDELQAAAVEMRRQYLDPAINIQAQIDAVTMEILAAGGRRKEVFIPAKSEEVCAKEKPTDPGGPSPPTAA